MKTSADSAVNPDLIAHAADTDQNLLGSIKTVNLRIAVHELCSEFFSQVEFVNVTSNQLNKVIQNVPNLKLSYLENFSGLGVDQNRLVKVGSTGSTFTLHAGNHIFSHTLVSAAKSIDYTAMNKMNKTVFLKCLRDFMVNKGFSFTLNNKELISNDQYHRRSSGYKQNYILRLVSQKISDVYASSSQRKAVAVQLMTHQMSEKRESPDPVQEQDLTPNEIRAFDALDLTKSFGAL